MVTKGWGMKDRWEKIERPSECPKQDTTIITKSD